MLLESSIRLNTHAAAGVTDVCIRAERLGKVIDGRMVLKDLSFEVARGMIVSVLGANGAGKSTLLKLLATLTSPTSGRLELFGRPPDGARSRARIGLVGHETMLYRDLTALENVMLTARLHGVPEARARALTMLDRLGVAERAGDAVRNLSRGTAQRVAIARALVHGPDLLIADEPFTGLDVGSCGVVERVFSEFRARGGTIVMSGHDVEQALRLGEHVLLLMEGRLASSEASHRIEASNLRKRIGGRE